MRMKKFTIINNLEREPEDKRYHIVKFRLKEKKNKKHCGENTNAMC